MQPKVIRAEDLTGDIALLERDDSLFLPSDVRKLWGVILLMAVRDRATSVHYHPWLNEWILTYIVDGIRYEMVPPPPEHADTIIDVARTVFTASGVKRILSRLLRGGFGGTTCSSVMFDARGERTLWDVVCWSSGTRCGVEFFRVSRWSHVFRMNNREAGFS